jgi:hypothetical protein
VGRHRCRGHVRGRGRDAGAPRDPRKLRVVQGVPDAGVYGQGTNDAEDTDDGTGQGGAHRHAAGAGAALQSHPRPHPHRHRRHPSEPGGEGRTLRGRMFRLTRRGRQCERNGTDRQAHGSKAEACSERGPVRVDADIGVDGPAHAQREQRRQRDGSHQSDHHGDGHRHGIAQTGRGRDPGAGHADSAQRGHVIADKGGRPGQDLSHGT